LKMMVSTVSRRSGNSMASGIAFVEPVLIVVNAVVAGLTEATVFVAGVEADGFTIDVGMVNDADVAAGRMPDGLVEVVKRE
jgi:hypothetical protein